MSYTVDMAGNHGGKRDNVGRKPYVSPELKKEGIYLKLPHWILDWLADQAKKSEESRASIIETALMKTFKLKPPAELTPPPPKKYKLKPSEELPTPPKRR